MQVYVYVRSIYVCANSYMHPEISKETYCNIEVTTGQSKPHEDTEAERLSRYKILSHHAGMRFFSPESYPKYR